MERIRYRRGFSLIELLVVLTIILVLMLIVLTSQSSFNKTLILQNTAFDIATTLRFAETYGLGTRAFGTNVNAGYGLHFTAGSPSTFLMFSDTNPSVGSANLCHTPPANDPTGPAAQPGNCFYDVGEIVNQYSLGNGITLNNICAYVGATKYCSGAAALSSLDIIFARPNPKPFMSRDGFYPSDPALRVTSACLSVTSPQGGQQYVTVQTSGQITARSTPCP